MAWNEKKARAAIAAFALDDAAMARAADAFREEIERGLAGGASSLRLLPSYLSMPSREERGVFLALDFGGTNVRAERVRLAGGGRYETEARAARPLAVPGAYNHMDGSETADGLFGFLAELVGELLAGGRAAPYRLGHTFSFPSAQDSPRDARLLAWTKEIAVRGVEGERVNALLAKALAARGLANVTPAAILNDTTAALLAAGYRWGGTAVGAIWATGFNACYLEPERGGAPPMVRNLEAGGFRRLAQNAYDRALDAASEKPGAQRLEKMVSGRYLGHLFSLALGDILDTRLPPLSGADVSAAARGEAGETLARLCGAPLSPERADAARSLAAALVVRAARLAAAAFAGTLRHRADGGKIPPQRIAVEGSFFAHTPLARDALNSALRTLLGEEAAGVEAVPLDGGASLGAAIAAAMTA